MTALTSHRTVPRIALLAALATSATVSAQMPIRFHQLLDINQTWEAHGDHSTQILRFNAFGDRVVFCFSQGLARPVDGCWVTDGTGDGTTRFADLEFLGRPAHVGGSSIFEVGGAICSFGTLGTGLPALWCSDGTPAGTRPIYWTADAHLYTSSSYRLGNAAIVVTVRQDGGYTLFRTDGSPQGTWRVADLDLGIVVERDSRFVFDDSFYFCATHEDTRARDLWMTDGTPAGTLLLEPHTEGRPGLCTALGEYRKLGTAVLGDRIVFNCDERWRTLSYASDLCAASSPTGEVEVIARDVWAESGALDADHEQLFFWRYDEAGYQIWRTDGTAGGTYRLTSIPENYDISRSRSWILDSGYLFMTAVRRQPGEDPPPWDLWIADGPTGVVQKLLAGANPPVRALSKRHAFFEVFNRDAWQMETWTTDGTPDGTRLLMVDLDIGNSSQLGDQLVFNGAGPQSPDDRELWVSDGTEDGTRLVREFTVRTDDSYPSHFARVGDRVVFLADDGVRGMEPWISDGTAEGTYLLGDTEPGPGDSRYEPESIDDGLLACFGGSLWCSDGSPGSLGRMPISLSCRHKPVVYRDRHFVVGSMNGIVGMWSSNGTAEGTTVVKAIPDVASIDLGQPVVAMGRLFFEVDDGLWSSDGTEEGTRQVFGGGDLSVHKLLGGVEGRLLLLAADAEHGVELWATDGTSAGTFLLRDINPGSASTFDWRFSEEEWSIVNGRLYFAAYDPEHGREPWVCDGTSEGTVLLADLGLPNDTGSSQRNSDPVHFVPVGERVSFVTTGYYGHRFVTTDGTPEGTTVQWSDRDYPLPVSDRTFPFKGKLLYYFGGDSALGIQSGMWETDGTIEGTRQIAALDLPWGDFDPRPLRSSIAVAGEDRLLLRGGEHYAGTELWVGEPVGPREPAGRIP